MNMANMGEGLARPDWWVRAMLGVGEVDMGGR